MGQKKKRHGAVIALGRTSAAAKEKKKKIDANKSCGRRLIYV